MAILSLLGLGSISLAMAVVALVLVAALLGNVAVMIAFAVPILIVVVTVPIIGACRYLIRLRRKIDYINRLFIEALEGMCVIRAFNWQKREIASFGETNDETARISRSSVAATIVGAAFPQFPIVNPGDTPTLPILE